MNKRQYATCTTEIGEVFVVVENDKIQAVYIGEEDFKNSRDHLDTMHNPQHPLLLESINQLLEYFSGKRSDFELPLQTVGTEFQMSVWEQLRGIPYGKTMNYQEVASAVGNPKAVRAIGQANKANKLPIIIPCHRVIGKNRSLTGYAGTRTDVKAKLLSLEGAAFKN